MKLTTGQSSGRAAFYDRNPTSVLQQFVSAISPAGNTQRWSYTVPAARKSVWEHRHVLIYRVVVATTAGEVDGIDLLALNAGVARNMAHAIFTANLVGTTDRIGGSAVNVIMQSNDVASATSADASTGGTVQFELVSKFTEYDA